LQDVVLPGTDRSVRENGGSGISTMVDIGPPSWARAVVDQPCC